MCQIKLAPLLPLFIWACGTTSITERPTTDESAVRPYTIGIVVSDIEKATVWYERALELKVYKKMDFPDYDGLKIYFLEGPHFQLELIAKDTSFSIDEYVEGYNINDKPMIGLAKVAFRVPDIVAAQKRLADLGAEEVLGITESDEFDNTFFIVRDQDGNVLQFIQPRG